MTHLAIQGRNLIIQRVDEFLLRLDVLPDELQLIHRRRLIFLGLLEHLIRLLDFLLQLLLLLLQILHALAIGGSKE